MTDKLNKWFDNFGKRMDSLFDGFDEAIEEAVGSSSSGSSIQTVNGLTVITKDGHVEIKGTVKSITINGTKIYTR